LKAGGFMKIKMIVTDLDHTLLQTDGSISEYTKTTLAKHRRLGIKIVYATGRGGSAEEVAPSELFDGRIINNGAVTFADEDIYKHLISYQDARPLLMACDRCGFKVTTQIGAMHYTNFDFFLVWPYMKNFEIVDFSNHELDAEKIIITVVSHEDAEFIKEYLTDNMYLTVARDRLGMIMHRDATKSKAIAELARIWGITPCEIVAFGDDLNDIDMLAYAGIGVAMGNALDEVKSITDHICDTNDSDGVAKWLEKNVP
jgi:Cof subfamily protein (haloacid dehalogenase superfamily)